MAKKEFNGFATEEQYKAVKDIIVDEIDDYTSTIMVNKKSTSIEVTIWTKTNQYLVRYWMDGDGVFRVDLDDKCMASEECKILVALDDCSREIFGIINTYDSQVRLRKFLGGDDTVLEGYNEKVKDWAISARNTIDSTIKADIRKIAKDVIRDIGYGVSLWRDEDIFPILEEHYGITVTNCGNKYIHFKYAA